MKIVKVLGCFAAVLCLFAFPAFSQDNPESVMHGASVIHAIHSDISPALRDIPPASNDAGVKRVVPNRPLNLPPGQQGRDTVVQAAQGPLVSATAGLNFDGIAHGNYAPPDTNGDAGLTLYGQVVNVQIQWFNKSNGSSYYGPVNTSTLWSGFGGGCQTNNDGDAVIKYDKAADKWVVTQFSVSTTPYLECVAVSTTNDPKGTWARYAFSQPNFNDYPKMSVWPDAYYITYNMFTNTFQGGRVCAMDRTKMVAGDLSATQVCFQLSTSYGGLLPADLYGSTTPPAGTPNYVMNFGSNKLNLWKFHVDFATPANSTFTGPTAITVASFTSACGGGTCIQQSGTNNKLDSLADRLMNRLVYRNLGTSESLLVNHSVKTGGSKRSEIDGVRWYELRLTGGNASVYQQGSFSPDSTSRWMGSIGMDKNGNIAIGYSASSSALKPSIRYTGRAPGDALGTMQSEATVITGGGSQTGSLHRWGDYSSMSIDPSDDCTFWFTTEYIPSNGTFNWKTRINSFKMNGCQ